MPNFLDVPPEVQNAIACDYFDPTNIEDRLEENLGGGVRHLRPRHHNLLRVSHTMLNNYRGMYQTSGELLLQDQAIATPFTAHATGHHTLVGTVRVLSENSSRLNLVLSAADHYHNLRDLVWTVYPCSDPHRIEYYEPNKVQLDEVKSSPRSIINSLCPDFDNIAAACRSLRARLPTVKMRIRISVLYYQIQCSRDPIVTHERLVEYSLDPNDPDSLRLVHHSRGTTGGPQHLNCEACEAALSS